MAYADELERPNNSSIHLMVIKPRRLVPNTWVQESIGTTRHKTTAGIDFDIPGNRIVSVIHNGIVYTENATLPLTTGSQKYYFETETKILHIAKPTGSGGTTPPNANEVVFVYELYLATQDIPWYRVPNDDTTTTVFFEGALASVPVIQSSVSDVNFGFSPSFSTSVSVNNGHQFFNRHLYDSSFHAVKAEIYELLGDRLVNNVNLILEAVIDSYSFSDDEVQFRLTSRISDFDKEFRNSQGTNGSFMNQIDINTNFVEPGFIGTAMRWHFGIHDGVKMINLDYEDQSPTTSDNRIYTVGMNNYDPLVEPTGSSGTTGSAFKSTLVSSSPASTLTRTYVSSADGFNVGDSIKNGSTLPIGYAFVTAVDKSGAPDIIDHTSWTSSIAASFNDTIGRNDIPFIEVRKADGTIAKAHWERDFLTGVGGAAGQGFAHWKRIILDASFESNLGIATLTPQDTLWCRYYGARRYESMGGSPFGSNSSDTGTNSNGISILWAILNRHFGLTESQIDQTSWQDALSTITEDVSFVFPKDPNARSFPSFKELITEVSKSLLISFYLNSENKWAIKQLAPITSTSAMITDNEIGLRSFVYDFDYRDTYTEINVNYNYRDISAEGATQSTINTTTATAGIGLKDLHGIRRTFVIDSLYYYLADAQVLRDRLGYMLFDRSGKLTVKVPREFFNSEIQDDLTISRSKLPGFEYDENTNQTRDFNVIEVEKNEIDVKLVLDDQKGIQDNEADW